MTTRHTFARIDLGTMLLVAKGSRLSGAYFEGHVHPPQADLIGEPVAEHDDQVLVQAARELREYLVGERQQFDIAVHTAGDPFSEQVWSQLRRIPFGTTTTYGAIATGLGNPGLAQRVGQAVGRNPIMIVVPCHRVLGADGSLTGYAGGLERKRKLLALEEPPPAHAGRLF
ncbi:MAG: methylated-DNA--[protein]-cysteine S-methyltransferase [Leucobacter sp.]|nr:methylated-DNA--[protein]-cysteine S-methyltransferase [Leucobacter sp.]